MMFTKIAALALMAGFYVCYFAKMLHQKKQGITTDQLGKGKEGPARLIEVALKTTTCLVPPIQIASIALYQGTLPAWIRFCGITVLAMGVLSFLLSVTHMKNNWRAGVQKDAKTDLVTDGIYSISRNPAFLGFDLMYIGILTTFFNLFLCVATVIALILFHLQIVSVEEPFLTEAFGQEYLDYQNRVHRYWGRKKHWHKLA